MIRLTASNELTWGAEKTWSVLVDGEVKAKVWKFGKNYLFRATYYRSLSAVQKAAKQMYS